MCPLGADSSGHPAAYAGGMASADPDVERRVAVLGWVSLGLAVAALVLLFAPLPVDDAQLLTLKVAALQMSVVAVFIALRSRRLVVAHKVERGWQPGLGGMILGGFALAAALIGVVIPMLAAG